MSDSALDAVQKRPYQSPFPYIFMGTPDFAAHILRTLLAAGLPPTAVYSRPDAISQRGSLSIPSPVSQVAVDHKVPLFRPQTLSDRQTLAALAAFRPRPRLIIVAAYGLILPPQVLAIPERNCVNVHASLLPRWRGAAPVQRALLAGDTQTGVSLMQMEAGLDTGPYCAQVLVPTAGKNAIALTSELAEVGAALLLDRLPRLLDGTILWTPQQEALVTYAAKVEKKELRLSPEATAGDLALRVRAATESTPARLRLAGRDAHALAAEVLRADDPSLEGNKLPAGVVLVDKRGAVLGCSDGSALLLTQLRPAGKRAMAAADWLRGVAVPERCAHKGGTLTWG